MHSLDASRFHSVQEVAQQHGCSVAVVLAAVASGELEHLRIGERVLITLGTIEAWKPSPQPAAMEGG